MSPDHTSPARAHRQTKRRHTLRHTLFFLILLLFALPQLHADDLRLNPVIRGLADGKSYEPGGANRLFSGARGNVQDRKNRLKVWAPPPTVSGNIETQSAHISGSYEYQTHFHNHGWRVHSPFTNTAVRNRRGKGGNVTDGSGANR